MTQQLPTKDRILEAAERLFAEQGIDGTSIREICSTANANHAAINYYFNGKEDLVQAVVGSHMTNVAVRRTTLLDDIDKKDTPSVRDYVEALVVPLSEFIESEGDTGQVYAAMMARLFNDRPDLLWSANLKYNRDNLNRIVTGLSNALPELPIETITQRLTLSATIMLQSLAKPLHFNSDGSTNNPNSFHTRDTYELIDFIVGGITASPY